jgi:hypothetical protein
MLYKNWILYFFHKIHTPPIARTYWDVLAITFSSFTNRLLPSLYYK